MREALLSVDTFSLCELQLLLKFLVFNDLLLASGVRLFSITVALAEQIQEIPYRIVILIPPATALFAPVPNSAGGIPFFNGPAIVAFLSCILHSRAPVVGCSGYGPLMFDVRRLIVGLLHAMNALIEGLAGLLS